MKISIDRKKLNDYQALAARTITDDEKRMPLFYLPNWALGICGEAGELYDLLSHKAIKMQPEEFRAAAIKEIGDILWYLAAFCSSSATNWLFFDVVIGSFSNKEMKYPISLHESTVLIMEIAGTLAETTKKIVYHGHDDCDKLKTDISLLYFHLTKINILLNLDMKEILDENIAKLEARYPDGFDVEKSKNRVENEG